MSQPLGVPYKMAFDGSKWSNEDIRDALKKLGVAAGPVTETTRAVYIKKLKYRLQEQGLSSPPTNTHRLSKRVNNSTNEENPSHNLGTANVSAEGPSEVGSVQSSEVANVGRSQLLRPNHHSIPEPIRESATSTAVSAPPPPPCSSNSAKEVIARVLETFDDNNHVANDTVFLFQGGEAISVSRSILASQCHQLVPILYNSEDIFPVKVSSLSGQTQDYLVRDQELVVDLKEKIFLRQGLRAEQQRLVFRQKELQDSQTLHRCGLEPGSTLHLVLAGQSESSSSSTTSYSCVSYHPALSIHHFHLNLHPDLLQPCPSSLSHTCLAPQLSHIVHVANGHYHGFRLFLKYLYGSELRPDGVAPEASVVESYAVCWTLGEYFQVPSLVSACRTAIHQLLTNLDVDQICKYAEAVENNALKDLVQNYV